MKMANRRAARRLLALMVIMGAFLLPAANALVADTTPPTLTAELRGDTLTVAAQDKDSGIEAIFIGEHRFSTLANGMASVHFRDYAGTEKQVAIYATDTAGNRSEPVMIDNPYYVAPATPTPVPTLAPTPVPPPTIAPTPVPTPVPTPAPPPPTPAPALPPPPTPVPAPAATPSAAAPALPEPEPQPVAEEPREANPFTPDGAATVQDNATDEDGKEFFTIVTENENTFFLVIDRQRDSENVYFLNAVTEADLMALAEAPETPAPVEAPAPTVRTTPPPPAPEPEDEPEPEQSEGGAGTIIIVVLAVLGVGGAGYYFKILKPRKQAQSQDEQEDYEDEEDAGEDEYYFGGEDYDQPGASDSEDE